jgi:oxygen-independent coproporphyrinogen-3 oxidase
MLRKNFDVSSDAEITIEANPEDLDSSYLFELCSMGINRLSIGAQSAISEELALMKRTHDFDRVIASVHMARDTGFENINLDLIYGLPGQNLKKWQITLQAALDLAPDHLSLYCLTIETGTPMFNWIKHGHMQPPDPDNAADQYELARSTLSARGYNHYEISNWSLPGRASEHNLNYWRNGEYLGFGAGAHGHAGGYRYWTVKQPRVYIRRMKSKDNPDYPLSNATAGFERLSKAQAISDTIITQLRLLDEGLNLSEFSKKFGRSLHDIYPDQISNLINLGLLREEDDRLLLTRKGHLLSNQVFYHFL